MNTAKVFKSGNSQAVRLPKEFRINHDAVYITNVGDSIMLIPKKGKWKNFIESLELFSNDFMDERNQPVVEVSEEL
ncbi:MAG: type II toxin-antitoxin system VapB family antitoxin [Ignavibacteria bacterium]|jgi:antitoxin VapB